ncbi:MAG: SOS response-associated peptidase [Oscillospiraceae bacterium]|nr:SOS response-associated peptidase [Oscillospiraceae bacterium]
MCGRYIANSEDEIMEIREILKQISLRLSYTEVDVSSALAEVFPTHEVMFIHAAGADIISGAKGKFGLEKWDKKGVIINAKSETYENNYFRQFAKNRCIVPAHGYFEWLKAEDKPRASAPKIKYTFTSNDKHGIFMAGIYNKNNEFAIITKSAEPEISFIHPRMPLIISAAQVEDWLSGKAQISELVKQGSGLLYEKAG